jgi:glycerol-3-phosphate cytidylyltransferase
LGFNTGQQALFSFVLRRFGLKKVITFGTFDVFHVGHINILERAAKQGDYLIVGVSSDELNFSKKGRYPIYNENDRCKIISSLKYVDEVFIEESLEKKKEYIINYDANILVMGDDWAGRFDWVNDVCDVIYLPRTPSISTTEIIEVVKSSKR